MKDFRLDLKIRNNRILSYIYQLGYPNIAQFCKAKRLHCSEVGKFINLKKAPIKKNGEWEYQAIKLADALGCEADDLWTDIQRTTALKKNRYEVEISEKEALGYFEKQNHALLLEQKETSDLLKEVLHTLTPKEEKVLRLRFGIPPETKEHNLRETGERLDITQERVRQIEAKALRKLKHPSRLKILNTLYE